MPPKKAADAKAAPKKKKVLGPEDGGALDFEAQAKLAMFQCNSYQVQLAERSDETSKALSERREIQRKLEQMTQDYENEKRTCFEITQVMTRDYKGMQVELLDRIKKLEDTILSLRDKLSHADAIQGKIIKEKDAELQRKEDEINDLNMKMDDMAEEFSQMLKETLDKMKERIEVTTTSAGNFGNYSSDYDEDDDLPLVQKRMEEINLSRRGKS